MTALDRALALTLSREGGDTNDPNDPGGLTRFGIAQKMHPEIEVDKLNLATATDFYRRNYWDALGLDKVSEISERVAMKLFDIAVSQGRARPIVWLQRALNSSGASVTEDGKIGGQTLAATDRIVSLGGEQRLLTGIRVHSLRQRINRIQERPDQVRYLEGWAMRSLDLDGRWETA